MAGIITSLPPLVEQPPGNNSSNPAGLPGVTYTFALLQYPQTWTAKQTFPLGNISLNAADVTGLFANPSASVGLTANNGTALTAMRSDATPALSQAITPTWTGAHTFNGGVTTNGAAGFSQPFLSSTSLSGSGAFPTGAAANLFAVPNDTYAGGATAINGLAVSHVAGGSAMTGGRHALASFFQLSAPSSASNTNRNYVGGQITAFATSGDGGTDTGANAKGQMFGIGGWGDLQSGATNFLNVTASELNVSIRTGASAKVKTILQLSEHALDAVSGASVDTALAITAQTGAIGLNKAIDFNDMSGRPPTTATGTLIGSSNLNASSFAAAHGVDLSGYTFSSDAFKSNGFFVDGSGNVTSPSFNGGNFQAGAANTFYWNGRAQIVSPADGVIRLWNSLNTGFTRLNFGGDTASFPSIKRNLTALNFRLADDSADAPITAGTVNASGSVNAGGSLIVNDAAAPQVTLSVAGAGKAGFQWNVAAGAFLVDTFAAAAPIILRINSIESVRVNTPSTANTLAVTGGITATTSITSNGATSGIGYSTGAGGTVTQATSRTTGVTLNTVTGSITLVSAAGSATAASFTVTNSAVAATDIVKVCQKSGTDLYQIFVTAVAAGSFKITFFTTGGTTTEQPVFNFVIIKGVNA